jgi:hypothetical protein
MKNNMKLSLKNPLKHNRDSGLIVLLGSSQPGQEVLEALSQMTHLTVREAFTTRGVLQNLSGVHLVILGDLVSLTDVSNEVMQSTLDRSGIPFVSQAGFLADPDEWLGRARLTSAKQVSFLPARQINLMNWSGGVGKTALAMAVCKRFVQNTGLPAALFELSMGGSTLQARISPDLPEFYAIATHKENPALWNGVSLYPMDGRTFDVLWSEDPQGIRTMLAEIQRKHTLFVVDCFPGHHLFAELSKPRTGLVNMVIATPRDDAIFQARRLLSEIAEPRHLIMNMTNSVADRAEEGMSVNLPYNETWAQSLDPRLADPLLELVYSGWKRRNA